MPGHFLKLQESDLKGCLLPDSTMYWSLTEAAIFGNDNKVEIDFICADIFLAMMYHSAVRYVGGRS